jgi:hypothetical protein
MSFTPLPLRRAPGVWVPGARYVGSYGVYNCCLSPSFAAWLALRFINDRLALTILTIKPRPRPLRPPPGGAGGGGGGAIAVGLTLGRGEAVEWRCGGGDAIG